MLGFWLVNKWHDTAEYVSAEKLDALIRLQYDFEDWGETLEYAE